MKIEDVMEYIKSMNAEELDLMMHTLLDRKREIFADWEMLYMAIP